MTASRLTARPMPRRTLLSFGRGNDVGIAVISAIFRPTSNFGKGEAMWRGGDGRASIIPTNFSRTRGVDERPKAPPNRATSCGGPIGDAYPLDNVALFLGVP